MVSFLSAYKTKRKYQYLLSVALIGVVALVGYSIADLTGYRVVALLLLVAVSLLAMFFDMAPVLLAALLSALIWDYFFIPPRLTFHISSAEDTLMLLMYFFIALINAALTFKIRQMDKAIRRKEGKENAIRLYNTVMNSLSHELRTPITTILGAADGLAQGDGRLSEANKQELVSEITAAALRLNLQVENLLNMSRLESGFIQPKADWCDVTDLVYTVVNRLEGKLSGHFLVVHIAEGLPLFKLDFGMMDQILQNLLSNAAQHTPSGSKIMIAACAVGDGLSLSVSDTGKGFPEEEMHKAFDKFYRLPQAPTGGVGLGLSIVKGFVQAMGGSIQLRNLREGGALFQVHIPAETMYLSVNKNEE